MSRPLLKFALGVFALQLAGCGCGNTGTGTRPGEVRYVVDEGGVQQIKTEGLYEFQPTAMGTTEPPELRLIVQNTGLGTLTVDKLEKSSGDAVKLGDEGDANPVFTVEYAKGTEIAAADRKEFVIRFTPPVTPNQRVVEHEVKVKLSAGNVTADSSITDITIRGRAISGECELPDTIDFGGVNVMNRAGKAVVFANAGIVDAEALADRIMSASGDAPFTYKSDSPNGEFIVAPGRERTVTIEFSPAESRDYVANVRMRRAKGCPTKTVRLLGTGVASCISWRATPTDDMTNFSRVDFGYVQPQTTANGEVQFRNVCAFPVTISSLAVTEATFRVTEAAPNDLSQITVPPGTRDSMQALVPGTAVVKVSFRPIALGTRSGQLRGTTPLVNQASIAVTLRGAGGGPDIDVLPANLNFGRVGYFAGANPAAFVQRKITIRNVGTRPNPPDPRANLKLLEVNGKKYFSVRAVSGATEAELCVGEWDNTNQTCKNDLPTSGAGRYDPNIGLEASGANAILDVPVRVVPASLGMKVWEVTVYSNDPDEAEFKFQVRADAQLLPPCRYDIVPRQLNFGVVTPPQSKDLSFKIVNLGTTATEICYISGMEMAAGSDAIFSLPAGQVDQLEIAPNSEQIVVVRAWPQTALQGSTPTNVNAQVTFNVSSNTNPQGVVGMSATLANTCLTISPNDLNFGTVQKDCNSPPRTFQVYNTCSTAVQINSYRMAAESRVPNGTGVCSNMAGCPEFQIVSVPSNFVGSLAPGQTRSFELKYRPYNYGPDTGAFAINVTQGGMPVDYLVTLRGAGDMTGSNEDVFRQDSKPKADILFVVDNSCSMSEEQQFLGTNFTAFLRYAVGNQVDFQIGVTTTDDDNGGEQGRLVASPAGVKIFKPSTMNLEQQFSAVVNLGTGGSASETCLSPAVKALTAPLITDPAANAGFLRADAVLAVVCITDELEQAPNPNSFYVNQLQNVKGAQRANMFSYNVVGPFVAGSSCIFASDLDAPPTGRHSAAVQAMNGIKENICTQNWAVALEALGKVAFGFRTNFFLTARPEDAGNIHVFIDNVELDPVDESRGTPGTPVWSYDPVGNAVVFEPLYVPEPGKSLTIRYQVACIP